MWLKCDASTRLFGRYTGRALRRDRRLLTNERNFVWDLGCVSNSWQNSVGCFHGGSAELMRSSWKRTRTAAQRQNGGGEVKNGPKEADSRGENKTQVSLLKHTNSTKVDNSFNQASAPDGPGRMDCFVGGGDRKQISGARSDQISRFLCAQESAQLSCWPDWTGQSQCLLSAPCSTGRDKLYWTQIPARDALKGRRGRPLTEKGARLGEPLRMWSLGRSSAEVSPSGCKKSDLLECPSRVPASRAHGCAPLRSCGRSQGEGKWEKQPVTQPHTPALGVQTGAKANSAGIRHQKNNQHVFTVTVFQKQSFQNNYSNIQGFKELITTNIHWLLFIIF